MCRPTYKKAENQDRIATPTLTTDLELAAAILARDRKASAEFVRLHADAVYGLVWRRLAPRTDIVEDLVQDVFLAALAALKSYNGSAPLRSWLLGIAQHKIDDYYRGRLRSVVLDVEDMQEPMDPAVSAVQLMEAEQESARAATVLSALRYEYALLLRWRYWDQRSAREMAADLGKTEKAVERMLARAREEFRKQWNSGREGEGGR